MSEQPNTECCICGSPINAGSYPPCCSEDCESEWMLETGMNAGLVETVKVGERCGHTIESFVKAINDL